jgi:hypothetical protein
MSRFVSSMMADSPLLLLPLISLVLFGVVFVVTSYRALRTRVEVSDRMSALPLEEDAVTPRRGEP